MRVLTKIATGVVAAGVVATSVAACSSSGDSKPVGSFKTLSGQSTTVVFDANFLKALTGLGVAPSGEGKATLGMMNGSTTATFPITGGNATIYKKGSVTPYVQGKIEHDGSGLNLKAGSTTVTLENFVVNPGNDSNLTGKVLANGSTFAASTRLFDLDGNTLQTPTISGGVATLQGTTIYVNPGAAKALNTAFKLTGSKALPTTSKAIKVGTAIIKATGS